MTYAIAAAALGPMSAELLDVAADVGSEEDEEYDEETGELISKENGVNGHIEDSSEEEDDDDDEEAAAAVSLTLLLISGASVLTLAISCTRFGRVS